MTQNIGYATDAVGSFIGGIAETQEVLDFCADHGITPDVELIDMADINKAFDRMVDKDVRFRGTCCS